MQLQINSYIVALRSTIVVFGNFSKKLTITVPCSLHVVRFFTQIKARQSGTPRLAALHKFYRAAELCRMQLHARERRSLPCPTSKIGV